MVLSAAGALANAVWLSSHAFSVTDVQGWVFLVSNNAGYRKEVLSAVSGSRQLVHQALKRIKTKSPNSWEPHGKLFVFHADRSPGKLDRTIWRIVEVKESFVHRSSGFRVSVPPGWHVPGGRFVE